MAHTYDLSETFVSLGLDGRTLPMRVDEKFWTDLASGKIGAGPGRLLSLFAFDQPWDSWEIHPNGDEVVVLLEGNAEMTLERSAGGTETVRLERPGTFVLIERGTWHTARTDVPTRMLFVTDGEGTDHRPA